MLDSNIAIKATNLGKCYHIYNKPFDKLKQIILSPEKKYYSEFWALQNINFELKKGESLGIIGRNGSGKSTLLQILCNTLTPTTGNIETHGRIAALLELGAGFNSEFSGRENVYLNGAILGFSRKEMHDRFDTIAEFADIGDHIDQPVKTYSSGMFVRLAFAVQASVDPDILIVDEALSVGDIFFQQKCAKRMQLLREKGTSLIFVSHDMASIRDLCDRALYLKNGQLIFSGESNQAIRHYFAEPYTNNTKKTSVLRSLESEPRATLAAIDQFKNNAYWVKNQTDPSNQSNAEIVAIHITDDNDFPTLKVAMGNELKFHILFRTTLPSLGIALSLRNRYNHLVNCTGFKLNEIEYVENGYVLFEFKVQCMIESGVYTFAIQLTNPHDIPNQGTMLDQSPWLGPISITWDYENITAPWYGMFGIPILGNTKKINSDDLITS